jgi:acetyl esterase
VRYLGAIHDFVMLNPISDTNAARSAIQLANATLRNALAGPGAALGSRRTD